MKYLKIIGAELLRVFGVLWLLIEATGYFVSNAAAVKIKELWWVFLLIGVSISIVRLIPKRRFQFIVAERDITVELVIGDIFKENGPVVVGANTGFITNFDVISPKSIQGIFCNKNFPSIQPVKDQINSQILNLPCDFGTTITVRGSEKIGYFCAIAEINESGVARSSLENLRISLVGLWSYLADHAEKDIINIPVLGSGFSRISAKRGELVRELLLSFFAAITQSTFCDGIRIVIHPKDIKNYNIDIHELVKLIEYSCKYSLSEPLGNGSGVAE